MARGLTAPITIRGMLIPKSFWEIAVAEITFGSGAPSGINVTLACYATESLAGNPEMVLDSRRIQLSPLDVASAAAMTVRTLYGVPGASKLKVLDLFHDMLLRVAVESGSIQELLPPANTP